MLCFVIEEQPDRTVSIMNRGVLMLIKNVCPKWVNNNLNVIERAPNSKLFKIFHPESLKFVIIGKQIQKRVWGTL